jgi:hypothetical protein
VGSEAMIAPESGSSNTSTLLIGFHGSEPDFVARTCQVSDSSESEAKIRNVVPESCEGLVQWNLS